MPGTALLLAGLALLSAPVERVERSVGAMGTTFTLVVEAPSRARALAAAEAAVAALEQTEARLSTWIDTSELSRVNRAAMEESVPLSPATAQELEAALACRKETGGAFDPTIGPLVDAWALRAGGRVPSAAEISRALDRSGAHRLTLEADGRARWRALPGRLEEGGFGKGAGLDRAATALLAAEPAARAWLNLGGQVSIAGRGPAWSVPIADPRDRARAALVLRLAAGSSSTSGNSEQGWQLDGVRYGHLLDPRSGRPAPDFGSLTVVTSRSLDADCLSTGLYVLGPDAALAWAARHAGVEVLSLEPRGERVRARLTAGLAAAIESVAPGVDLDLVVEARPES